eukprot:UN18553
MANNICYIFVLYSLLYIPILFTLNIQVARVVITKFVFLFKCYNLALILSSTGIVCINAAKTVIVVYQVQYLFDCNIIYAN